MTATLQHYYAPRGSSKRLFEIREPEVLVSGPAGTGKSRACMEKLHLMALVNPGMRGLIVRKTLSSLGSTALQTWRQWVAKESFESGDVEYYGGSAQEPAQYRYRNGSVIVVGGLDKASRIMSSEYDVIYVQEATELTEDDWEALTTRLRNGVVSFQQLVADANPNTPTHWLKLRCDQGKTYMLASEHEENPVLWDERGFWTDFGESYIAKLDALTGVRHLRLRRGLWVAAEGLVYEEWSPTVHLVDRFPIPYEWTRFWSIDFGYSNPFVCQFWAEDPEGKLWLYRELYHTRRTVDVHARQILDLVTEPASDNANYRGTWTEPKPRAVICDHDAEGRAQLQRDLGLSTVAAHKKVTEGIQAVQVRLRDAKIAILRDSLVERDPTLVDAKKPCCTEEEIPGYIWDTGAGKAPKEQPLKVDDHGCDALRYVVAQRDLGSRPRVRWL